MAEDSILHTTEILRSALPHVNTKSKLTLDLLVKLYELIVCLRNYRTNDVTACSFEDEKMDMEALLNNIRPKCNEKERPFVDRILSIFQTKRMFEMYNTYMEAMKTMQGFEGFGGGASDENDSGGGANSFSGFDFSSIFGNDFNAASFSDGDGDLNSDDIDEHRDSMPDYNNLYTDEEYPDKGDYYSLYSDKALTDDTGNNNVSDSNNISDSDTIPGSDTASGNNNSMFESLKSMIPPEQMGTFENLRMLFGSMSYDDSSNPNNNKE